MIETILLAMLVAKIKGYKLKPFFKSLSAYPVIIFSFIYIFIGISIFYGNYSFIKYEVWLEKIYILMFIPLIFKYKLYISSIIGSLFIFIGTYLNNIAINANNGKMPVFPTLSYITGYVKPDSFSKIKDIHILGDNSTKLKLLTDYIDLGYSILSIGDIFIRFFTFIVIFDFIKYININLKEKTS